MLTVQNEFCLRSRTQNMFSFPDFRCYFEVNGPNHIHFLLKVRNLSPMAFLVILNGG